MYRLAVERFQHRIWDYYRENRRDLPWRNTSDSYQILVSEIMLQQTQVERVLKKYPEFLNRFPNFTALAEAPLSEVLAVWQGMGYNRRALALKKISEIVTSKYGGELPRDVEMLDAFPGIGKYTAAAIAAFAFNIPAVCLETNIRRVFIHFFFTKRKKVKDDEILELIQATMDHENPREWYFALMDYGAMLGKMVRQAHHKQENPNRKSANYRKQTPFKGSNRERRGKMVRIFTRHKALSEKEIEKFIGVGGKRLFALLESLGRDGFIVKKEKKYFLR